MTQEDTNQPNKLDIFWDRYNGTSNIDLALKYSYYKLNTINDYFAKGGKWHEEYKKYEGELDKEAIKEAKKLLHRGVNPATKVLLNKLKSNDEAIQLKAAKEIIDREFGKAMERLKHDVDLESNDLKQISTSIKKILER